MVAAMEEARLHVDVHVAEFPVAVAKTAWLSFIRNKTWSEFSMCTDEEMTQGKPFSMCTDEEMTQGKPFSMCTDEEMTQGK